MVCREITFYLWFINLRYSNVSFAVQYCCVNGNLYSKRVGFVFCLEVLVVDVFHFQLKKSEIPCKLRIFS